MEIGQQGIYHQEFIAGIYEEIGLARSGLNFTRLHSSIFQSSNRRGADSYDAARLAACMANLFGSLCGNRVGFRVKLVLFDSFHAHRSEGSESNMERDLGRFDVT